MSVWLREKLIQDSIFINKVINFLGLGLSLYALAGTYQYFSHDPIIKHTVKCKYCRKRINEKVSSFCYHILPIKARLTLG